MMHSNRSHTLCCYVTQRGGHCADATLTHTYVLRHILLRWIYILWGPNTHNRQHSTVCKCSLPENEFTFSNWRRRLLHACVSMSVYWLPGTAYACSADNNFLYCRRMEFQCVLGWLSWNRFCVWRLSTKEKKRTRDDDYRISINYVQHRHNTRKTSVDRMESNSVQNWNSNKNAHKFKYSFHIRRKIRACLWRWTVKERTIPCNW